MTTPVGVGGAIGAKAGAAAAGAAKTATSLVTAPFDAARAWVSDRHNIVRVAWVGSGLVLFAIGVHQLIQRATGIDAVGIQGAVARKAAPVASLVMGAKK